MSVISQRVMSVYPPFSEDTTAYDINVEITEIDPSRPTLVCLHGYLGSSEDFDYAFERFDNKYNIVTLDLRGHGKSGIPLDPNASWSIRALADDVYQVLKLILPENTKVDIVASSMSTAIALELAKDYPTMVNSLFLLSPTTRFAIPAWVKIILSIGKITPGKLMENLIDLVGSMIPKFADEQEKDFWEKGVAKFTNMDLQTHKKIFEETLADWEADLDGLYQPVFIVSGSDDKVVPHEKSIELAENLPNASMLRIEGAEHFLIRMESKIVYDTLEQWLVNQHSIIKNKWYSSADINDQIMIETSKKDHHE